MTLPVPNLDDRRFQDLVDDAKRLVQRNCPEWTDHNVSDPGVTLIEAFAGMVDQLLYRLNRVPDRNYVKFLDLIGVHLFPPTAATTDVTYWLSAPQPEPIDVPASTQVATVRTETVESIVFTSVEDLAIVPCSLERLLSSVKEKAFRDHNDAVPGGVSFYCFDTQPKAGDALYIGLDNPVPSCAVALTFDCEIEGVGVDPRDPPIVWEAWAGGDWAPCEVDHDDTGGLNRAGEVVLHVPRGHEASVIDKQRAGWLRCRVTEAEEGQPFYSASPRINRVEAATVGGTSRAVHAHVVEDEILGLSEGVAGQRLPLQHRPVVPGDAPMVVEVAGGDGWDEWTCVPNFADSGPDDRHFVLDEVAGEVSFGPQVRERDGSLVTYGAIPGKGAPIRVRIYRTGGGQEGNVARGTLNVLRTSIPFVARVENRMPASGGVEGEDMEQAKVRGPILLRTLGRAVTAEDYEQLAIEAAPNVARVRCVAAGDGTEAGGVRVLVVPAVADVDGQIEFEQMILPDDMGERIRAHLDERRTIGARVLVEAPSYQGVTVVARLKPRARTDPARLQKDAVAALYRYFHPIGGGPDGNGWPFGRPVHVGEVYGVLQRLRGTELVEDARLFGANPITGERGEATQKLDIDNNALVFSFGHQVMVTGA